MAEEKDKSSWRGSRWIETPLSEDNVQKPINNNDVQVSIDRGKEMHVTQVIQNISFKEKLLLRFLWGFPFVVVVGLLVRTIATTPILWSPKIDTSKIEYSEIILTTDLDKEIPQGQAVLCNNTRLFSEEKDLFLPVSGKSGNSFIKVTVVGFTQNCPQNMQPSLQLNPEEYKLLHSEDENIPPERKFIKALISQPIKK